MTLQYNIGMLRIHETMSISRLTFALHNPYLDQERIVVPYRSNSNVPLPNNYAGHMVPDNFSAHLAFATRAANASRNSTITIIKLFETRDRANVKLNVDYYRNLNGGMVEYTRRLVANHEDAILASIQPGSRIIGVLGLVLCFSPSRGYEGPPPGYRGQDGSSGSLQADGPPYPGPSGSQNLPQYGSDMNLYPPCLPTLNVNFGPLELQTYPPFPPPTYQPGPFHHQPAVQINHYPDMSAPYPTVNDPNQPPGDLEDVLLQFN